MFPKPEKISVILDLIFNISILWVVILFYLNYILNDIAEVLIIE